MDKNNIFTKEEFFQKMNEFKEKWMKMLDIKDSQIQKEITTIKENSLDLMKKSQIIIDNYSTEKIYESKVNELESFKNKVNDMLITHEVRINNNIKEISNISNKYEKMIADNLYIPGYIGPACQYKNLSEYITYNMSEVSKLRSEKDGLKIEQKDYKSKMDNFMKQMMILNDNNLIRSKEYTNSKQKDYELLIEGKLQPLNDKVFRFYELSSQSQSKVEKEINIFRNEIEKILKIKEELIKIINDKEQEIKNNLETANKKIVMNIQDIGINKNHIKELKDKVNELNEFYTKINSSIGDINKEINNINNNLKKKDKKNIRKTVAFINSPIFKNKLDKNNLSPRSQRSNNRENEDINNVLNTSEITTEREEEKNDNKDIKNNKNKNNLKNNNKTEEGNKINEAEKINLKKFNPEFKTKLTKFNTDNKNKLAKSNYKTFYNKMIKEKEKDNDDIVFETFYLGKTKIPIITKPFFLDQKILSDEELTRFYIEKKEKRKEKLKIEKIRKSLIDNNLTTKPKNNNKVIGKNLDINYYKLSIPKLIFNQKSEENLITPLESRKMKELKENQNQNNNNNKNMNSIEKNNYKLHHMKHLNFINLRLDDNASINPNTNNGAYVIAKKQLENSNISRINITPTSYVNIIDTSKETKTSKLVSMTFMREEQRMKNFGNYTLNNEENRIFSFN